MESIVLFDPAGVSGINLRKVARKLGFKVIAVFTLPEKNLKELYHDKELFKGWDDIILSDERQEILDKLKTVSVRAAIAATESGVELADQIANSLNLWGNSIDYSEERRNKSKMREILKINGFSCPDFAQCDSLEKAIKFAKGHRFPLVIKTPKGAGTSQVYVCDHLKNLTEAFHKIYGQKNLYGQIADHALIEEYIGGKEYVVDTFSDGEAVHVTDVWLYEKIDVANLKNIYYNVYSLSLDDPSLTNLIQHAIKIVKAFRILRGPAHMELKEDPTRGPTLIEIGARLVGRNLSDLISKYTNFDPYRLMIEVFSNGKTQVPYPIVYQKHFGVAFCPIIQTGVIDNILGIEEIKKLKSYDSHSLNIKKGDFVSLNASVFTVPIVVYFAHANREQIQRDLASAHKYFQLELG